MNSLFSGVTSMVSNTVSSLNIYSYFSGSTTVTPNGSSSSLKTINNNIKPIKKFKKRKSTKQPIYAEIGEDAEIFLTNLLNSQNGYETQPPKSKPLSSCKIGVLKPNIIIILLSYLPIKNLIRLVKYDKKFKTLCNKVLFDREYLKCCVHAGVEDRENVWPWLVGSDIEGYHKLYLKKLVQWRLIESGTINKSELRATFRALSKDIHRTFTITRNENKSFLLNEYQQKQLQTLLGVYSLLDPDVGYVQGMNFIAGIIILTIKDELNAFAIFCQLMKRNKSPPFHIVYDFINNSNNSMTHYNHTKFNRHNYYHAYCGGGRVSKTGQIGYGVRDMFTKSLPGCVICLLQFEQLVQKYLPKLYEHFKSEGLYTESFASEWFMTLFSYILPIQISFRIFDIFFIDGYKILHRIGLSILSKSDIILRKLNMDDMLKYLKSLNNNVNNIFLHENDIKPGDVFIKHAMSFKVSNAKLHDCATYLLLKTKVHIDKQFNSLN